MNLACPRCGRTFPVADISLDLGIALCRPCDLSTDLRSLRDASGSTSGAGAPGFASSTFGAPARELAPASSIFGSPDGSLEPAARPRPAVVSETKDGWGLTLSYRWFSPIAFFLVFFVIAWDGFLAFWYANALGFGVAGGGGFGLFAGMFALPHAAVGVGLTYFTACLFVNRTTLTVGGGRVAVAHGPLPWRGNLDVASSSIAGLRVIERESRTNRGRGRAVTWDVQLDSKGVAVPLLTGLDDEEVARWLAERLGRALQVSVR